MTDAALPQWDLRRHAAATPARDAIVCGDERLRYGELEALANRFADMFRRIGLVRGDHLATLLGNRPEGLAVAWAAWRSGLYLTPLSTASSASELLYLVADCDARAVVADAALRELAASLPAAPGTGVQWLALRGAIAGFREAGPLLEQASPSPQADEPPGALMMYTSGTTGAPKGVIRPLLPADWRGTPPFAADLIDLFDLGGDAVRYLSTAPLYHAAPLRVALAVTAGGGCVHVMDRFDAAQALELIATRGITHSQWVPAMFQRLLALPEAQRRGFAAPAHRVAIHGAAPCPPALKASMIGWWGPVLLEYYSGSEGVGLTLIDSASALRHPGSVGRARKGRLHVVDDAGNECPAGVDGLVCFSGLPAFAYHKAPEKTSARTLERGLQTFGDIGHVDADGYLYLTDRQADMIISGGVNIYPQEIEAAIREVAGVWDCAVVGVPDERFGERPVAFVVARHDDFPPETPAETVADAAGLVDAVRAHCQARLGRYKQPAAIHAIESLPSSATGKLRRRALRDAAMAGRTPPG